MSGCSTAPGAGLERFETVAGARQYDSGLGSAREARGSPTGSGDIPTSDERQPQAFDAGFLLAYFD